MTQPPIIPGVPQPSGTPDVPEPVGGQPVPAAAPPAAASPSAPTPARRTTSWFVLGAGIAAVIGSFLPWVIVSAPLFGTQSKSGVDGSDGRTTVVLGALLIYIGAQSLSGKRVGRGLQVIGVFGALALLGLGGWNLYDVEEKEREMRDNLARLASDPDDIFGIGRAISAGAQVDIGNGLRLIVLAGLVGLISTVRLRKSHASDAGQASH